MITDQSRSEFSARLNLALDYRGVAPKGRGRQSIVAEQFHVSQKGARKWLEGEAIPHTTRIPEIARWLEINGEWLLTGGGSMRADALARRGITEINDRLDVSVIEEILDIIEERREYFDDPPQSNRALASVIADNYYAVAREKRNKYKYEVARIIAESLNRDVKGNPVDGTSS